MHYSLVLFVVTSLLTFEAVVSSSGISWTRCSSSPNDRSECGRAYVSECHEGLCDAATATNNASVGVKVVRVLANTTAPIVWWVASHEERVDNTAIGTLAVAQNLNIYSLQLRGISGVESKCPFANATTPSVTSPMDALMRDVAECANNLNSTGASSVQSPFQLPTISLTGHALDVAAILEAADTQPSIIYARGRATLVLRRLMQLASAQERIAGYVFDSMLPPFVSQEDDGIAHVADAMLLACKRDDENCGTFFDGVDPRDALRDILTSIDLPNANGCALTIRQTLQDEFEQVPPSYAFRQVLARLLADKEKVLLIPPLLARMRRCNHDDNNAVTKLVASQRVYAQASSWRPPPRLTTLQDRVVDFSERWSDPPTANATLQTRYQASLLGNATELTLLSAYCAFSNDASAACKELYTGNISYNATAPKLVYPKAITFVSSPSTSITAYTNANVLFFASRMNPTAPASYTHAMYQTITTSGTKLAVYSDGVQDNELLGANAIHSGRLQRVVALFAARVTAAKPVSITGKWHVDQVESLLASPDNAKPLSAVDVDVVALAFNATDGDLAMKYFGTEGLYNLTNGESGIAAIVTTTKSEHHTAAVWIGVLVGVGVVVCGGGLCYCFKDKLRNKLRDCRTRRVLVGHAAAASSFRIRRAQSRSLQRRDTSWSDRYDNPAAARAYREMLRDEPQRRLREWRQRRDNERGVEDARHQRFEPSQQYTARVNDQPQMRDLMNNETQLTDPTW